ncbi:Phosphatidylethanolamine N-methyltransferase [invertebrate metagenome]|uniref:Phosphatidylethanolamine N-methyltransferase n=1 Tax=invertebrate metagenome TaxID=1711999 RepID=A0A484H6C6_9ZZZZ
MKTSSVLAAYRRYARVYDVVFGKLFETGRRHVVSQVNHMPQVQRVLEAGVGTGLSLGLYRRDLRVVGIDLSVDMLAQARRRVEQRELMQVQALEVMDVQRLLYPDDNFDVVVAMYLLSVVPDPGKALAELIRVCKPGGSVIVLNHFTAETGHMGPLIQRPLSRFSEVLGWRPYFPLRFLLECANGIEVGSVRRLPPFGMFAMVEGRKRIVSPNAITL